MVDLKANPYYLSDEDCKWVEETIASMTPEEKVGQLFFQLTSSQEEEYLKELMEKYHLGGCRYNPMPGKNVQEQNRMLQKYAKVPVFIACNIRSLPLLRWTFFQAHAHTPSCPSPQLSLRIRSKFRLRRRRLRPPRCYMR